MYFQMCSWDILVEGDYNFHSKYAGGKPQGAHRGINQRSSFCRVFVVARSGALRRLGFQAKHEVMKCKGIPLGHVFNARKLLQVSP
jgi:hypothetical protein